MTGRKLYKHIYRGFIAVALVITVIFLFVLHSSYESMKSKFEYEAGGSARPICEAGGYSA